LRSVSEDAQSFIRDQVLNGEMPKALEELLRQMLNAWRLPILGLASSSLSPSSIFASSVDGETTDIRLDYGVSEDPKGSFASVFTSIWEGFSLNNGRMVKTSQTRVIHLRSEVLAQQDEINDQSHVEEGPEIPVEVLGEQVTGKTLTTSRIEAVEFDVPKLGIRGALLTRNQSVGIPRLLLVRNLEPFLIARREQIGKTFET
jgi:hypothetical protein